MRVPLMIAALSIGYAAHARADVVFSAPAYGGASQSIAVCYYSTSRTKVVSFTKSAIVREDAVELQELSESCSGGGFSGGICRTVANISNNVAHYCEATVSSKKLVRGRLEIRSNAGVVLTTEEIK